MKTKHWIVLFALLVGAAVITQLLLIRAPHEGRVAAIYVGPRLVDTIDLDRVTEPYQITILADNGLENVILIEPGQISMLSSTCRDQICVHQGPITDGVTPIVCLPHRVVIEIRRIPGDPVDAVGG